MIIFNQHKDHPYRLTNLPCLARSSSFAASSASVVVALSRRAARPASSRFIASARSPPLSAWCVSETRPRWRVPATSDGALFTSRSHTRRSSSTRTSRPRSSKCRRSFDALVFVFVFAADDNAASPRVTAGRAASTATRAVATTRVHTRANDPAPRSSSRNAPNVSNDQFRLKCASASGPSRETGAPTAPLAPLSLKSSLWCSRAVASALFVRCFFTSASNTSYGAAAKRTKPSAYAYARTPSRTCPFPSVSSFRDSSSLSSSGSFGSPQLVTSTYTRMSTFLPNTRRGRGTYRCTT
mmetsp:Transcript_9154/g.38496  ORF Transcript_9154/g.38496 Transcript_9154/m.38496 type:complete len:297 (-) Transcript_9154:943-1833(-)